MDRWGRIRIISIDLGLVLLRHRLSYDNVHHAMLSVRRFGCLPLRHWHSDGGQSPGASRCQGPNIFCPRNPWNALKLTYSNMGSSQNTSKKFQLRLGMEQGGKRENKEDGMRDWRDNEGTGKGEAPEHVQRPNNPNMSKGRVTPLLRAELHRTKQHLFTLVDCWGYVKHVRTA